MWWHDVDVVRVIELLHACAYASVEGGDELTDTSYSYRMYAL